MGFCFPWSNTRHRKNPTLCTFEPAAPQGIPAAPPLTSRLTPGQAKGCHTLCSYDPLISQMSLRWTPESCQTYQLFFLQDLAGFGFVNSAVIRQQVENTLLSFSLPAPLGLGVAPFPSELNCAVMGMSQDSVHSCHSSNCNVWTCLKPCTEIEDWTGGCEGFRPYPISIYSVALIPGYALSPPLVWLYLFFRSRLPIRLQSSWGVSFYKSYSNQCQAQFQRTSQSCPPVCHKTGPGRYACQTPARSTILG